MLIDPSREDVGRYRAGTRNGVTSDVQEHVVWANGHVIESIRLLVGDESQSLDSEAFVVDVLTADERDA
jgi:hypothetical protein